MWGFQLEDAGSVSSPIKTTGTPAERLRQRYTLATLSGYTANEYTMRFVVVPLINYDAPIYGVELGDRVIWGHFSATNDTSQVFFVGGTDQIRYVRNSPAGSATVETSIGDLNYQAGDSLDIEIQQSAANGITISVNGAQYTNSSAAAKSTYSGVLTNHHLGNINPAQDSSALALIQTFQFWTSAIPFVL